jgi:hypothetical protein
MQLTLVLPLRNQTMLTGYSKARDGASRNHHIQVDATIRERDLRRG